MIVSGAGERARKIRQSLDLWWPREIDGYLIAWTKNGGTFAAPPRSAEIEQWIAREDEAGRDVYVGMGLQRGAPGPGKRGSAAGVCALPGVWVDIDTAGPGHAAGNLPTSLGEVIERLLVPFGPEPSIAIMTSGGVHAHWLASEPIAVTDANRAEIAGLVRAWQQRLITIAQSCGWHLDSTADLARVLRPAGTRNHKIAGQAREVDFAADVDPATAQRYALAELRAHAAGRVSVSVPATAENAPAVSLDEIRAAIASDRTPDRQAIYASILAGEPFARPGERDSTLQRVSSWLTARCPRDCAPESIAEILRPSLAAMAAASPDDHLTIDDAIEKISRAQSEIGGKRDVVAERDRGMLAAMMRVAQGGAPRPLPDGHWLRSLVPTIPANDVRPAPRSQRCDSILLADRRRAEVLPTGHERMDHDLDGGLQSGQVFALVAPTGAGKTGFALTIGAHVAAAGRAVLYVSTELSGAEAAARVAAIRASVLGKSYRTRQILRHDVAPKDAARTVEGMPIHVLSFADVELRGDPVDLIRAEVEALAEEHGRMPLVIVDYLQDIQVDPENMRNTVTAVSKGIRVMTAQLGCYTILISATSRANYARSDKPMSDDPADYVGVIKESGAGEYDCAQVSYLHTEVVTRDEPKQVKDARLFLAKERNGMLAVWGFRFDGPSGRFLEDPGAVRRLSSERTRADQASKLRERVLAFFAKHDRVYTRSQARDVIGLNKTVASEVIGELIEQGALRLYEVSRTEGGRTKRRDVIGLPATTETSATEAA